MANINNTQYNSKLLLSPKSKYYLYRNEFHVFFQCLRFVNIRMRYLYSWIHGLPSIDNFHMFFCNTNPVIIKKMVVFVLAFHEKPVLMIFFLHKC